jgi:hypothetical protein
LTATKHFLRLRNQTELLKQHQRSNGKNVHPASSLLSSFLCVDLRSVRQIGDRNLGSYITSRFVSLHPYFKIHPGKLDAVKAGFPRFVEKTAAEKANLFYEFSVSENDVFCREAYANAEGLLAHLDNVGGLLAEMLTMADLIRLEVHGPAEELAKLKNPMAHLNPVWFTLAS